jgi:membrane protein
VSSPTAPARGDLLFGRESARWLPAPAARAARFVYLTASEFSRNRCGEKAAALGFETVLSFVPALVLSLFLVNSFGDGLAKDLPRHLLHALYADEIGVTLPSGDGGQERLRLSDKIQEVASTADRGLRGGVSLASFLGLALAAIVLALTLEHALNDVWAAHGRRPLLLRVALAWTMLTLAPLIGVLTLSLTRGLPPLSGPAELVVRMAAPFAVLGALYRFVPAARVAPAAAALGALVGAAAWVAARKGFGYYLVYAEGVDKLYGTLGLLPIGLVWVWLAWVIVLLGAEVAYTAQNLARLTALERRRRLAPFAQPGLTALAVVLRAAQAFRAGKGAVSEAELAETTGLPDALWRRLSAVLLERRLLVPAGGDAQGFVPGRPLDALRVEEVFSAVEEALLARPEDAWPDEPNPLRGLSSQLAEARRRELAGRTIEQLLDGRAR